uniref:Uncharacterized protein n=1 Tax=Branchiostoma floridae TaxID=7739 RepID=C3XZP1_BRAFL|eukprot:XP_002610429.1 hypothetical protein BRAFLDRAFT_85567 [Branchiostoma floridae]
MDTGQESEVMAQTTLNAHTYENSDACELPAQDDNSHFYVFDHIEPNSVSYTYGDEENRGGSSSEAPGSLQGTTTEINGYEEHLAESPGSAFVENHPSDDTRDVSDDNGTRKGNADVHKPQKDPDGLPSNPTLAASGRQQATNGSCSIRRCFCLIATVVLVGLMTGAAFLAGMYHNAQEHGIEMSKNIRGSTNRTTLMVTMPVLITRSASAPHSVLHSTDASLQRSMTPRLQENVFVVNFN